MNAILAKVIYITCMVFTYIANIVVAAQPTIYIANMPMDNGILQSILSLAAGGLTLVFLAYTTYDMLESLRQRLQKMSAVPPVRTTSPSSK